MLASLVEILFCWKKANVLLIFKEVKYLKQNNHIFNFVKMKIQKLNVQNY